jgi:hypothetical protein
MIWSLVSMECHCQSSGILFLNSLANKLDFTNVRVGIRNDISIEIIGKHWSNREAYI